MFKLNEVKFSLQNAIVDFAVKFKEYLKEFFFLVVFFKEVDSLIQSWPPQQKASTKKAFFK